MTSGDFLFLSSSFAGVEDVVASYNFLRISKARQQEKWKKGRENTENNEEKFKLNSKEDKI